MASRWTPSSWRERPAEQQPVYRDPAAVEAALRVVRAMPPVVAPGEVEALRSQLAAVARGEAFLLQGGDCAERFVDCAPGPIESKVRVLLQMSLVLGWGAGLPIVRVARMAGQYAKPRSSDLEEVDGRAVPSYRGDHVNGHAPTDREPDPRRLVEASFRAAATLNYARALLEGGSAALHAPWAPGLRRGRDRNEHVEILARLHQALARGAREGLTPDGSLRKLPWYVSHEGLLLAWEEARTHRVGGRWYNLGAHTLWIGHRTRQLEGAHVEYFRGIDNPIGLKVGPGLDAPGLVRLLDRLDPDGEPGRITLVTRFGADHVGEALPPLVEAVRATGRSVVWSCDPMHGNTVTTGSGLKTRDVSRIRAELLQAIDIHERLGGRLGGVHLELTGEDVTECVGGPQGLTERDLPRSYETFCDPRLNYAQSLDLAFLLAARLARRPAHPGRSLPARLASPSA